MEEDTYFYPSHFTEQSYPRPYFHTRLMNQGKTDPTTRLEINHSVTNFEFPLLENNGVAEAESGFGFSQVLPDFQSYRSDIDK